MSGAIRTPQPGDYDTSYSAAVRKFNRTQGLFPPNVESTQTQTQRCLHQLGEKKENIEKYLYLSGLRNSSVHLFYRLLTDHIKTIAPLIYTPTVGEACQKWSHNYVQPEGLYLSYADRGNVAQILHNWPQPNVEITVITDGSRILGLGDLGINGMGIPIGKLALYTACAGIRPEATLPLTLDLGTNNKSLREDPLYLGSRQEKGSAEQELEFMDEIMVALNEKWPGIIVQFEDFKNPFPALQKYQEQYTCFNDDIQGTGAVILAGMVSAVKRSGIPAKDQRAVFLGAGSAGVGVAKQIVEFFTKEGLTEDEARRCFWLVDTKGLVTDDRGDKLAEHKIYFSRPDNNGKQYKTLEEVVEYVKPTILMGLSTIQNAFTPDILTKMAQWNKYPIVFPLSNPSANSECTFEDAVKYTKGTLLFASGSPFDPVEYEGKTFYAGQGNNMYVFPGIGLGTILSKATIVTQSMIYASATSLSLALSESEASEGLLYPRIERIRDVSVQVAVGVIRAAQEAGVDRETRIKGMGDDELQQWVRSKMYDPHLEKERVEQEVSGLTGSHLFKIRESENNKILRARIILAFGPLKKSAGTMWTRVSSKSNDTAENRGAQSSRRKDEDQRVNRRRTASTATSDVLSSEKGMKTSRGGRDERDVVRDGKRISERRRDRSPSPERERDKKTREGSRERKERKRERREKEKRERNSGKVEGDDHFQESTRGDFEAQVGSSGFMQFPGQFDGGLVGVPPTTSIPMSSHVPDQFPGQFPTTSAGPYRPPLAVGDGGPGLAADYYGDAGQSVADQPGVRPQQPALIVGAEPHLQPASSIVQPPPEPSASGGVGAAASFFSNTVDTETFNSQNSHYSSSAKPGSTYNQSTIRPESQNYSSTASVLPTVGAAAGYYMTSQSNSEEHRPQYTSSIAGSQTATSQRPSSHFDGSYDATAQYAGPITPGKHSSHSSNVPLYAAGAAGLAAAAYHQNHQSSQHSTNSQTFVNGSMAQKHRHRGPLSSFVDFFKDPEGVAQFEEYTEYIGVCRECFAPGSSPRDAPRKHHYQRRRSNDRYSMRIDKDSRYWSSDSEKRRKKNSNWLGAGIATYGLAKLGENFFNERNDLDDTYSVKSGHPKKSHASPDRKSSVSRGTIQRSSDVSSRHRRNSREYVETGITSDGRIYKKELHGGVAGKTRITTYGTRGRSKSKSRSRSHSGDRKNFSAGISVGSAIGSSAITSATRHRSRSPKKVFFEAKSRGHEKSPIRENKHRSRRSPERNTDATNIFNTQSTHHRKSHKKHKKRNGLSSFSSSSSSSSDAGSVSKSRSRRRRDSRREKAEHDDHRKAELAVAGLGAAAAALALESTRQSNKSRKRGDLVAVKESKSKHRQHPESRKRSKHLPSGSEDDVWESASEGDADSINSDLAYGSTIRRKDSRSSLSSDSSGTSKWGWRWGSAKKRSDRVKGSRKSDSHSVPYDGVGTGAAFGSAANGEGYDVDDHRPRITMHSNSSLPLQQAYSVPNSGSSHGAARNGSNLPTDYSIVSNRPEPVPIQHPQPITPVSSAVYTTQAPNRDSYNVSTGSAPAQPAYGQHAALDLRSGEAYNNATEPAVPGSFYEHSLPSATTAYAVPAEVKVRRRDSSPARYNPQSVATASFPPRRASVRENSSTVRFELPEERNEREDHAERSQTREDEERQKRRERQEMEEREHAQRETKEAKHRSQRKSESKLRREENPDDAQDIDGSPIVDIKSGKSISWAVPAAIGAATVAGAAIKAGTSQADSHEDDPHERRTRPMREMSPEHVHRDYEDLEHEERASANRKSRSARQEISKPKRTSSHEDYADFFTPTELLSRSPRYKETSTEADADSAITAFEIPQVITIEPSGFHDSREAPAYSFGPNGEEINPDPLAPPWVPRLKLISPTPRPSSPDGWEIGDASPLIKSPAVAEEFSDAASEPQPIIQDVLEEFQTPNYTIIEPKSVRRPHDDFVDSVLVEPETFTAPELQESPSAQFEGKHPKSAEDFGDDLEFAGTVAAGLSEAGFDPSIVVDNPGFRRRQSPPGSDDLQGYQRSFAEDFVDVSKEISTSDKVPAQQGFVEGEISPHMPGSFEEDEPTGDIKEPEVKLSKRERRKRDKETIRQGITESPDKDMNSERIIGNVTEPEAREKEPTELVREPDQYSSDDGRSAAATAPSYTEKSKGRKKKRSKRDSVALDDETSVVSSPTTRDEAQDTKSRSKSNKTGLFGLFSRSSVDASGPKVAVTEKSATATNGFDEPKKKSKRKSKDRRATQELEEIGAVEVDANDSPAKDSGRMTLPAEVPTPASTGRDPSPPAQNWLTNPEDEASVPSKEAKPRESASTDRTEKYDSPDHIESASFLGERQKLPPPPDISVPEESGLANVGSGTKDSFHMAARQPAITIRRSSSPLSTHRTDGPTSGASSLPSSPTSKYRGSSQRVSELHDVDKTLSSQHSPTAIPFHFRVPPSSPNVARTSSSLPQTPSTSEAVPTPSRPKLRPRSTEFKSSNEFRPLWLVSKHASFREKPIDEVYPSLPSSHTTSRSSSVHDPDESAHDRTLTLHEPDDDQGLVSGILIDHTQDQMESDLLDSQQPTPTASSFPAAIREQMQAAQATSSNIENPEHRMPAAAAVDLEDLPSLPSSRTSSPIREPEDKKWKASHDLKAITLGAVLGASAASAVAAIKHHQNDAEDLEISTYEQGRDMIEKEHIHPYVTPAKEPDSSIGAEYGQVLVDREKDEATRYPQTVYPSAVDVNPVTPQLPLATKNLKLGGVEQLSAEQQREIQEQDAQDAVDSWFAPTSPKQFRKKSKRKGQVNADAAETSTEAHAGATTGTASDDSFYMKSIDNKESETEQPTAREVADSVKQTEISAATKAPNDLGLTADLSVSEVVHRMSSAAEATKDEPAVVATIKSAEQDDKVEVQPLAESSTSKKRSGKKKSKSSGASIPKSSLETSFIDLERPETGPSIESMGEVANQGISSPLGNEVSNLPKEYSNSQRFNVSASIDGLLESAESIRTFSSKKKAKKIKDRSKQAANAEAELIPILEPTDERDQFQAQDEASFVKSTNEYPQIDDLPEITLPETDSNAKPVPLKRSKKSKKARRNILEDEHKNQDTAAQIKDVTREQSPVEGEIINHQGLQGPVHDKNTSQFNPNDDQSNEGISPKAEQPIITASPRIIPEDLPLPDSEDLDLLDESVDRPYVYMDSQSKENFAAEPFLTRMFSSDPTPREDSVTNPFDTPNEGEKDKDSTDPSPSKRNESDQLDAKASEALFKPIDHSASIASDQVPTFNMGTETELPRSLQHQPSDIEAEVARTEIEPTLPDEVEFPKDETSQNDLGDARDTEQMGPSVSALDTGSSLQMPEFGAPDTQHEEESSHSIPHELNPRMKLPESPPPNSRKGNDEISHVISSRDLLVEDTSQGINDQISIPGDADSSNDIHALKASLRESSPVDHAQAISYVGVVDRQPSEQLESDSSSRMHDPIREPDIILEDKSITSVTEHPLAYDSNEAGPRSPTLAQKVQESMPSRIPAASPRISAMEDSNLQGVDGMDSANNVQISDSGSPSPVAKSIYQSESSDQMPLSHVSSNPTAVDEKLAMPSTSTSTAQAVTDRLATTATEPAEELMMASLDLDSEPKPTRSPIEERDLEDIESTASTKEKKNERTSDKGETSRQETGDAQNPSAVKPPVAMTNTADEVKVLLEAENSQQSSTAMALQPQSADRTITDTAAEYALDNASIDQALVKKGKKEGKPEPGGLASVETLGSQEQQLKLFEGANDKTLHEGAPSIDSSQPFEDTLNSEVMVPIEQSKEPLERDDSISIEDPKSGSAIIELPKSQEPSGVTGEDLTHETRTRPFGNSKGDIDSRSPSIFDLDKTPRGDEDVLLGASKTTDSPLTELPLNASEKGNAPPSNQIEDGPLENFAGISSPALATAVGVAMNAAEEAVKSRRTSQDLSSMSKKDKKKAAKKKKNSAWDDELPTADADNRAAQDVIELATEPPDGAFVSSKKERKRSKKNQRLMRDEDAESLAGQDAYILPSDIQPTVTSENSRSIEEIPAKFDINDSSEAAEKPDMSSRDKINLEDAARDAEGPISENEINDLRLDTKRDNETTGSQTEERASDMFPSRSVDEVDLDDEQTIPELKNDSADFSESAPKEYLEDFPSGKKKTKKNKKREKVKSLPWEENSAPLTEDTISTGPFAGNPSQEPKKTGTVPPEEAEEDTVVQRQNKKAKKAKKSRSLSSADEVEAASSESNSAFANLDVPKASSYDVQETLSTIEEASEDQPARETVEQAYDRAYTNEAEKMDEAITKEQEPSLDNNSPVGRSQNPIELPTKKDKKEKKKAKKSKKVSWDDAETPEMQLEKLSDPNLTIEQVKVSEGSKNLDEPTSTDRSVKALQEEDLADVSSVRNAFLGPEITAPIKERQQKAEIPDVIGPVEAGDDQLTPIQNMDTEPDPSSAKKSKKNEKKKKKGAKQPKVLDLDEELAQAAPQVIEESMEDGSRRDLSDLPRSEFGHGVVDQLDSQKDDDHEATVPPREPADESTDLKDYKAPALSTTASEQLFKAPVASEQHTNDIVTATPTQVAPEQAHKRSFFEEEGPDMGVGEEIAIEPPSKTKRTDADPPSQKIVAMEEEVLAVPSKSKKKKKSKKGVAPSFDLEEPQRSDVLNEVEGAQRGGSAPADNENAEDSRYDEHDRQPQNVFQPTGRTLEDTSREAGLESQSLRPVKEAGEGAFSSDNPFTKANTRNESPYWSATEPTGADVHDSEADAMKTSSTATPSADVAFQSDPTGPIQRTANVDASAGLPEEWDSPRDRSQSSQADELYSFVSPPDTKSKKEKQKPPITWEDETASSPIVDRGDEHIPPSAMPLPQPHRAEPEPRLQQDHPVEFLEPETGLPKIEIANAQDSSLRHGDERSDYFSTPTQNAEGVISRDPNVPVLEHWPPANEAASPSVEEQVNKVRELVDTDRTTSDTQDISPYLQPAPLETRISTRGDEPQDHREAVPETHDTQVFNVGENGPPKKESIKSGEDIKMSVSEDSTRIGNLALEPGDDVRGLELGEDRGFKEQIAEESRYSSMPRDQGDPRPADEPLGADDFTPFTESRKAKKKSKKQARAAEMTDSRTLGDPADQETKQQRFESTKSRSRSSSPKQVPFSTLSEMQSNEQADTREPLAGLAGSLGAGAVVAANLDRRDSSQKGKNKRKKKSKARKDEEAAVPEPTTSYPQVKTEEDRPLPSLHGEAISTPPISPEAISTTISGRNDMDEDDATPHNASVNRDSAIHFSDSPNPSDNLFVHRVVRDSGYQDTEASPIIGLRDTASRERMSSANVHLGGNAESDREDQSFDHQSHQIVDGSATNPLNISVEADPAYDVKVVSPASQRHHSPEVSRLKSGQRSFAEEGFGVLNDEQVPPSMNENLSMPLPSGPSSGHDQRTLADTDSAISRGVLPTPVHDSHRQPSPVSPSTKDRSSVLFQSSPSTREELAHIQQHQDPSPQDDSGHGRALSPVRDDGGAVKDRVPHESLFGRPFGTGSEIPSPPSSPIASDAPHRRVLDTINEYSPDESPLQRKGRTRSYSPSPERGSRRRRRTDTRPRAQSPPVTKPETREASLTDDLISDVPRPELREEQHSIDVERSRSGSAENRAPSRQSVVSALGGAANAREGDYRSFSGASIKSGDSINAIIRTPDQVRSASGLSYHSSGTPPLRRVDRSVSGDLRAKSLAKQSEAEPPFASSSSYDPTKDKGKDKMADVYVSNADTDSDASDACDD
ncbi:MAG: hypothetical protein Q9195_002764 [Heterodermia aff. obscurata]